MRPRAITILCLVLFVLSVLSLLHSAAALLWFASKNLAMWYMATAFAHLLSVVGLWRMKKWGPVLWAAGLVICRTVAHTMMLPSSPWFVAAAFVLIYAAVVVPHWKQMT